MSTLERAIEIAVAAHKGTLDKHGQPYVLHPLRVMLSLQAHSLDAQIVGVLHDVLEDTDVTAEHLRSARFSDEVLNALALVTHSKAEPYADYVIRAKANPIARAVKLADLQDNMRPDRALIRTDPATAEADRRRMYRYLLSHKFLRDGLAEDDYRRMVSSNET